MPQLTPEQIVEILASGDFSRLLGIIEDERVEGKGAPYQIDAPVAARALHERRELSKDVAALANVAGGVIVVGASTERSPVHHGDEIRRVGAFPQTLITIEQYHAIIREWLYPQPEGIAIRWYLSITDPEHGLLAIRVPEQPERLKPFLLTRTLEEDQRVEVLFGYAERRRAGTDRARVQELHALLRDGRRFMELASRLEALEALTRELRERPSEPLAPEPAVSHETLRARRNDAIVAVGFPPGRPLVILTAVPTPAVALSELFQERSALVRALNHPPATRGGAFGVASGETQIIRGQLRRAATRATALELWRDGVLVFVADPSDLLCWGTLLDDGTLRFNPLGLCELPYSFVDLSRIVFEAANPRPQRIDYSLEFYNLTVDGHPARLGVGELNSMSLAFRSRDREAPDDHAAFDETWQGEPIRPGVVAYGLVREVYRWFGLDDDSIPYTRAGEGGMREIDPARFPP